MERDRAKKATCIEEQATVGSLLANTGQGDIGPELLPRAMSGSVVLLQLGSVLTSMVCVTTGDHRNHSC